MKPKFRSETRNAIDEIAKELGLPNKPDMQDWAYEVANPMDIEKYIAYYENIGDEDIKFVLMEMIIQAIEEQTIHEKFQKYCDLVKPCLERDFEIHEYTVFYWGVLDSLSSTDLWKVTPFMRRIWFTNKKREIPGLHPVEWREFRYVLDDGNDYFMGKSRQSRKQSLFDKIAGQIQPPIPQNGGVITENCKLWLPTEELFHGLSYKGDIEGWKRQIEEGAKQLGLLSAKIEDNKIQLSDNRSYNLSDCRVEFY